MGRDLEHLFCSECGRRMAERSALKNYVGPKFSTRTGENLQQQGLVIRLWSCPEADLKAWQQTPDKERHDVVEI